MNPDEIIKTLIGLPGISEAAHKVSFRCFREAKDGSTQDLIVDVYDNGSSVAADQRYYCRATSDDGKTATGNNARTVDEALEILHRDDLDK